MTDDTPSAASLPPATTAAACVVTVKRRGTKWRPEGTCGWTGSYWTGTSEGRDRAIRDGARHLHEVHGIYAGGTYV